MEHRQGPILGLVQGGDEEECATRRAWSVVMDGCSQALTTPGLPASERAALLEIRSCAAQIAERQNELLPSLVSADSR